jgi:hypothetical protein
MKFQIPIADIEKVRMWFRERGGVIHWSNLEIGNYRPEMITPAKTAEGRDYKNPHWSMGDPITLQPNNINVSTIEILQAPRSMFADCVRCDGTGKRSLLELASIRRESIDELRQQIDTISNLRNVDWTADSFDCTYCGGTGCDDYRKLYSHKRQYCSGITLVSCIKANKAKLLLERETGKIVEYDFSPISPIDGRMAELRFYHETITPFSLDIFAP